MFKVFKRSIPEYLINEVLKAHDEFKYSRLSFFKAQGTNQFEKPILDQYHNQINSIHNPHLLGFSRKFRKSHNNIIYHENISNALSSFTGAKNHIHWQSMFFDKSTATRLHQDTWYLDTRKRGKLVGVWIALEDISINSGPFIIYTNTDKHQLNPDLYNFKDLEKDINFLNDFPESKKYQFLAKKGDILIWDSFSIHGAEKVIKPNFTRKSITSHFYPNNLLPIDEPIKRFYSIYNHKKPIKTKNKSIFKAATINPYFYSLLCLLFKILKSLNTFLLREKFIKKSHKDLLDIRNIDKST